MLSSNNGGLPMRITSIMLWVILILNTIHESLIKYMFTTFKCKQFTISTPVELSVLFFILFQLHAC